jgi:ABC-type sugar transport system substrate-binding protein
MWRARDGRFGRRPGSWTVRGSVAVGVSAALAIALAACGGSSNGSGGTTTSAAKATTADAAASTVPAASKVKSVEMISPNAGQASWQVIAKCFTAEANRLGIQAKVVGAPGVSTSTPDNLNYLQQAVADGIGGVALATFSDPAALEPAIASARKHGVAIATMESGTASAARSFDVGLDITHYGLAVADEVASLPGVKKVGILVPGLAGTPVQFDNAFKQAIRGTPSVSLVSVVSDNGQVTDDADLVGNLLTAHPDINVIVAVNPGSTAGVVTAISEHNDVGKASLIGNGIASPAPQALKSGAAAAFYVQNVCSVGRLAVDDLVAAGKGQSVSKDIGVPSSFATKSNDTSFGGDWQ